MKIKVISFHFIYGSFRLFNDQIEIVLMLLQCIL